MNKMLLFTIAVVGGTIGILLLLNQKELSTSPSLAVSPTIPPLSLSQPSIAPSIKTPSITVVQNISPTPTAAAPSTLAKAQTAVIKTTKGDITLSLYPNDAPNTVNNFVQKAKSGFYNNLTFHRIEDWVIQGGDPKGDGTGGGNMPVEFNNKPFIVGSLGIASKGDGKVQNDAQFFITKKDASWLNGQYTNFGTVTKGIDVVSKMEIGDKILGIIVE